MPCWDVATCSAFSPDCKIEAQQYGIPKFIINLFTISLELLMADRIVQQSMITLFMMVIKL